MKGQIKTKAQLIAELEKARERISELEQAKAEWGQAEKLLRTSEENYRQLVELSPNGIVTINLKGIVLSVNRSFTDLTGFAENEFVGGHITKMPTKPKVFSSTVARIFSDIVKEKKIGIVEFEWQHKKWRNKKWGSQSWSDKKRKKGYRYTGCCFRHHRASAGRKGIA